MPEELERSRQVFSRRLAATRGKLSEELGVRPRHSVWLILLVAGAAGLAAAVGLRNQSAAALPPGDEQP